jgi:ParB/RepB/Spo0J family partition protein
MTITDGQSGIRALALEDIKLSTTGSQAERRKHFDKGAMAELAGSIKLHGVLVPVIARPVNGHFELVAGERRYIAAKAAGVSAITADVRSLTDEQVLEIQLIENLQREGLHELAEAEGYEQLQKLGHAAEEIADKVGKSKGYIYSRLKLCGLAKASRTAFYDGKLTASTALLLARIPIEVLQLEALKEITNKKWGEPIMTFRDAASHIRDNYMTNLSDAGFPTEDASLVAAAGACGACPKRTGNQAELFDDVKSGNVCTDPVCFKAKRQAFAERAIAASKDTGQVVITGKAAQKIAPHGAEHLHDGDYVRLDDHNYSDPKSRTNAQLLGKDYLPTLLQDPKSGKLVKVAKKADVSAVLTKAGVKRSGSDGNRYAAQARAAQKKTNLEKKFRATVYHEIRAKLPAKLGSEDLRVIALRFYYELQHDVRKLVMGMWQLEPVKSSNGYGQDLMKPVEKLLVGLEDAPLTRFLFDLVFIKELQIYQNSSEKPTLLLATAKKLKVNADKIRAELTAAAKPAKKPKGKKK